jgi:TDG/mug DNA glycosylase family protein
MPYDPDIIASGVDVVFCGIDRSVSVIAAGHSFSSDSNRVCCALPLSGFTDHQLRPEEERHHFGLWMRCDSRC